MKFLDAILDFGSTMRAPKRGENRQNDWPKVKVDSRGGMSVDLDEVLQSRTLQKHLRAMEAFEKRQKNKSSLSGSE